MDPFPLESYFNPVVGPHVEVTVVVKDETRRVVQARGEDGPASARIKLHNRAIEVVRHIEIAAAVKGKPWSVQVRCEDGSVAARIDFYNRVVVAIGDIDGSICMRTTVQSRKKHKALNESGEGVL